MGSVYSSEDEAVIDNVSDDKLITTAPRREDGDGMELPPTPTTAASDNTEQRSVEEASDDGEEFRAIDSHQPSDS